MSGPLCDDGRGPGGIESMKQAQAFQSTPEANRSPKPELVEVSVIREIGGVHPRFAATLANMNAYRMLMPGRYEIHWSPVPLTPDDVEAFLDRASHGEFFQKYDRDARRLNRQVEEGHLREIVYEVRIQGGTDEANRVITISLPKSSTQNDVDPPYSSLEVTSVRVAAANTREQRTIRSEQETVYSFWQVR